jgi:hypothetical protein
MFGVAEPEPSEAFPLIGSVTAFDGPFGHTGDQIRGYGYTHDGSVDTLFRFVSASLFDISPNQQSDVEAFMIAFDTDLAPIVGQQVTLTDTNSGVAGPRITLMRTRCGTGFASKVLFDLNGGSVNECDLVAKHSDGTNQRGYLYEPGTNTFAPDDGGTSITAAALLTIGGTPNQEVTYTAVPPGSGYRMGINRDLDIVLDGLDNCPGTPNDDQLDTDGDNIGDVCDPTPVPEPGEIALLVSGLLGLVGLDRRRRRTAAQSLG